MPAEQHGSRWLHAEPTEEQVKDWFNSQKLHTDMMHEPYYGGIVLIGAKEKYNRTYQNASGAWFVREEERAVFVPYVKVDTRVAYFWTLVQIMNIRAATTPESEDKYIGVIEPVPQRVIRNAASPYYNEHLPEGFFIWAASGSANNSTNRYVCAQWRVAIYERQSYARKLKGEHATPVLQGIGTKQTTQAKNYPDDNALMKAETGAIGRALGVAGILVVGTGIATAEDIQESIAAANTPIVNREGVPVDVNSLPPVVGADEDLHGQRIDGPDVGPAVADAQSPQDVDTELRERAGVLSAELKQYPEAWAKYLHWYQEERKFPSILDLTGPALKGALVKLERALQDAKTAPAPEPDAADAPAEPGQ
jgi:hypothetical protein